MFEKPNRPRGNSDLIENPSTRCACMLVLDTSSSMAGSPIAELNAGLKAFIEAVQADEIAAYALDLGVITAGSPAPCVRIVVASIEPRILGAMMEEQVGKIRTSIQGQGSGALAAA